MRESMTLTYRRDDEDGVHDKRIVLVMREDSKEIVRLTSMGDDLLGKLESMICH